MRAGPRLTLIFARGCRIILSARICLRALFVLREAVAALVLLWPLPAVCQQPTAPIRVNVDRVNVGVIVTDSRGNFVEGLRRGRSNTREGLANGLESLQHYDFDGFNLNFTREHAASHFVELSMLTGDGGVRR